MKDENILIAYSKDGNCDKYANRERLHEPAVKPCQSALLSWWKAVRPELMESAVPSLVDLLQPLQLVQLLQQ